MIFQILTELYRRNSTKHYHLLDFLKKLTLHFESDSIFIFICIRHGSDHKKKTALLVSEFKWLNYFKRTMRDVMRIDLDRKLFFPQTT